MSKMKRFRIQAIVVWGRDFTNLACLFAGSIGVAVLGATFWAVGFVTYPYQLGRTIPMDGQVGSWGTMTTFDYTFLGAFTLVMVLFALMLTALIAYVLGDLLWPKKVGAK